MSGDSKKPTVPGAKPAVGTKPRAAPVRSAAAAPARPATHATGAAAARVGAVRPAPAAAPRGAPALAAPPPPAGPALEKDVTYLVESDFDRGVLLAMDAQVRPDAIEWFDTCHDRAFEDPRAIERTPDGLRFEAGGNKYALRKLTVELYDAKVASKVEGPRRFPTTEAVQQFYREFPR